MHSELRRVLIATKEELAERYCGEVGLEEIAKFAGYSPFHFHREFSSLFGKTPAGFVRELRLAKAKRMLLTSDYSVADVCNEVGYASRTTFSREFARRHGEPPSEFRRVFSESGIWRLKLVPVCFMMNRKI